jgi:hypothetical protein
MLSQHKHKYTFEITKERYGYRISGHDEYRKILFATSGRTLEEAFDNLADAMKTAEGVKMSWWNKLLDKLKFY